MLSWILIHRMKEPVEMNEVAEKMSCNFSLHCLAFVANDATLSLVNLKIPLKFDEVKNVVEQPAERGNHSIESVQNFRVIHKSSISLNKTSQISSVHAVTPILLTKEPEYSPSMGYEHPNTTPKMKSDEIIKSDDDDISSDDDDFEDIEYVEASLSDPEIVSVAEENVVNQEEEEVDLEDISQIQDERLINVVKNHISDDSSNDPLLEEANNPLAFDNSIPPGIEIFAEDSERDIRFLKELLIDDSIPYPNNESPDSNSEDNPSFPRPPPEPPDAEFDFKPDSEEEIPVVMNDKDELNDDSSSFIFVIFAKVFSFLSAKSEDTIFDPGIFI
nr:hypothetical protein [Tanacetum cinerariifolium]